MTPIEEFILEYLWDVHGVFEQPPEFVAECVRTYQADPKFYDDLACKKKYSMEGMERAIWPDTKRRRNLSKAAMLRIFRRDSFTCKICGAAGVELTIDHIKPVSKGGGNEPENLQAACRPCNEAKGAKHD